MKKFIVLFNFIAIVNIFAINDMLIGFEEFQKVMHSAKINDLSLIEVNNENINYYAIFGNLKSKKTVFVHLFNPDRFNDFKKLKNYKDTEVYKYMNFPSAYYGNEKNTFLSVLVENINATVLISTVSMESKDFMEDFVNKTGLLDLKQDILNYPSIIDSDVRIDGQIKSIDKFDATTEGFTLEYHVFFVKNERLVKSIKQIANKFNGNLENINFDKGILICAFTDSMLQLEKIIDGEIVEFIYYIK